ncbi:23S rRNA methylase (modular protein) [Desulfosarcina cetonica]|nr:23S rRNA methylase (modular protein) [Desulfosarcina cetonica]
MNQMRLPCWHSFIPLPFPQKRPEQIDGQGEDRRGVVLGGHFTHGLQVAQLEGHGMGVDDLGGLGQTIGCLVFTLGVDHLGPPFPLGFGLLGHGALHLLGQVDVLELHRGDLDAPGIGMGIQDFLQLGVDLFPRREQFVQLGLAAHAAQGRLGQLGDGVSVVLHLHDGLDRFDHAEIDHGIDLHRDVVPGDHVLGIHIHGHQAQAHLDHFVHDGNQDDQPRSLGLNNPSQAEDHPPFVLVENFKGRGQEKDHQHDNADIGIHGGSPLL